MKTLPTMKPPTCGEDISNYAKQLQAEADANACAVTAIFNEVEIMAVPGGEHRAVTLQWQKDMDAKAEAYRKSPEGIAARKRQEQREKEETAKANALLAEMQAADLKDLDTAISFVERSSVFGWTYTQDQSRQYVALLAAAGYEPNVNCGEQFDAEDRRNVAEWLIGQAMTMPGHGIEQKFCKQWREKFGEVPA